MNQDPNELQQQSFPPQQQWPSQAPMTPMQQPVQPPPKKRRVGRFVGIGCGALAVALVIIIAIAIGTSSHSENTLVNTPPSPQATSAPTNQPTSASPPAQTTFRIGETATNGMWSVTMNSVKTATSGAYASPAAGNIYLVVDVTTENLSSTPQLVSSEASFTLKDTTGQAYNEAITGIGVSPDGTIQPGTKLRGQIVYEVPKSLHDFTFQFQGDVFGGSAAVWAFSV